MGKALNCQETFKVKMIDLKLRILQGYLGWCWRYWVRIQCQKGANWEINYFLKGYLHRLDNNSKSVPRFNSKNPSSIENNSKN